LSDMAITRTWLLARLSLIYTMAVLLVSCSKEEREWIDVPLADNVFFEERPAYRSDVIEIPVFALSDLEYKLDMKQGNAIAYQWQAQNLVDPTSLLIEFHGHTIRTSDAPGDVMFYKVSRGDTSEGYMVAPFDGIHGWYFSNESSQDIMVELRLSGFYTISEDSNSEDSKL